MQMDHICHAYEAVPCTTTKYFNRINPSFISIFDGGTARHYTDNISRRVRKVTEDK
jgi:hypothetical protein